jgi:hypothetical protein
MPRRTSKQPPISHETECQVGGKSYKARYSVSGGLVTVSWVYGQKSAVPGASGAAVIARLLLQELVQDAIRNGYVKSSE